MANDRQASLKIISLNVCGLRGKTRQLGQLISKFAPDIVCLQETNVRDKYTQTKIESELKVKNSIFNNKVYRPVGRGGVHTVPPTKQKGLNLT